MSGAQMMMAIKASLELFAAAHRLVLGELKPFEFMKFNGNLRELIAIRIDNDFYDPILIASEVVTDVRAVLKATEDAHHELSNT
jgi:hypothetical protein